MAKAATSQQQWYVTISRGKKGIHIFTTDKEQLRENITRSADRPSVLDLLTAHYQNDPRYRRFEQRWGPRAAVIRTRHRRAQKCKARRLNQTQSQGEVIGQKIEPDQIQAEAPNKQSRSMGV